MNAEIIELEGLDPNAKIMARWIELGQIAKNASAERDAMKPDIVAALEDGELFELGESMLTLVDKETTTFDWKRAVGDGVLTKDQADHYLKRTMSRYPQTVKKA